MIHKPLEWTDKSVQGFVRSEARNWERMTWGHYDSDDCEQEAALVFLGMKHDKPSRQVMADFRRATRGRIIDIARAAQTRRQVRVVDMTPQDDASERRFEPEDPYEPLLREDVPDTFEEVEALLKEKRKRGPMNITPERRRKLQEHMRRVQKLRWKK